MTTQVAIVQRRLTHYRVPLFNSLRERLAAQGITLRLLHGDPTEDERIKRDEGELAWAERLPTRYFARGRICWQPFAARTRDCQLVIVTQENKLVNNLFPLLDSWRQQKLAFWGHGRNMQAQANDAVHERFKRWTTRRVDWWFAYTELTRQTVVEAGFPPDRITVLNNAIDNRSFERDLASISAAEVAALRERIGAAASAPIGLYCGSLYPEKRLDLMLQAADRIRLALPTFQLVVIGDGPSAVLVHKAAGCRPWLHPVGSQRGRDKAGWYRLAGVILNPGLVGLNVLDSFVAGVPMVTTADALHSPEIAYLVDGENGVVAPSSPAAYAEVLLALLADDPSLAKLKAGALRAAQTYTLDTMTERFVGGVQACLAAPRWRR